MSWRLSSGSLHDRCGYCGEKIAHGVALYQWEKCKLIRCAQHAPEPRPKQIGQASSTPDQPPIVSKVVPFTKLGDVQKPDIKQRQLQEQDQ